MKARTRTCKALRVSPLLVSLLVSLLATMLSLPARAQDCSDDRQRVRDIQLVNVTLLDAAAASRALMAAAGLPPAACLAPDALTQIAVALQQRYADAGYGAIKVLRPQPPGADGVLRLEAVEGRLVGQPTVTGIRRLPVDDVLASLPSLVPGQPIRIRELDAELRIANENPAKETQLLLLPGPEGGSGVQAEIRVRELAVQRISLSLDNSGEPATGRHRLGLAWRHANLSGNDDVLSLQAQTSPEYPSRVRVFSAGYRWPLYGPALLIDAFAGYSSTEGNHATAAGALTLNGRGSAVGVKATWVLRRWGAFDQRLGVGIDHREYRNDCAIAGLPDGACGPGGADLGMTPLSLDYVAQRGGNLPAAFSARLQRSVDIGSANADAAQFDAARSGARPDALALRVAASMLVPFADDWQAQLRASGQLTRHPMVSGEMFGAGGQASVRGYRERELTGDQGLAAGLEIGRVGLLTPRTDGKVAVNLYGFVDGAVLRNHGELQCLAGRVRCAMASWGVGARSNGKAWWAQIDVARTLRAAASTPRGETRLQFSLAAHIER